MTSNIPERSITSTSSVPIPTEEIGVEEKAAATTWVRDTQAAYMQGLNFEPAQLDSLVASRPQMPKPAEVDIPPLQSIPLPKMEDFIYTPNFTEKDFPDLLSSELNEMILAKGREQGLTDRQIARLQWLNDHREFATDIDLATLLSFDEDAIRNITKDYPKAAPKNPKEALKQHATDKADSELYAAHFDTQLEKAGLSEDEKKAYRFAFYNNEEATPEMQSKVKPLQEAALQGAREQAGMSAAYTPKLDSKGINDEITFTFKQDYEAALEKSGLSDEDKGRARFLTFHGDFKEKILPEERAQYDRVSEANSRIEGQVAAGLKKRYSLPSNYALDPLYKSTYNGQLAGTFTFGAMRALEAFAANPTNPVTGETLPELNGKQLREIQYSMVRPGNNLVGAEMQEIASALSAKVVPQVQKQFQLPSNFGLPLDAVKPDIFLKAATIYAHRAIAAAESDLEAAFAAIEAEEETPEGSEYMDWIARINNALSTMKQELFVMLTEDSDKAKEFTLANMETQLELLEHEQARIKKAMEKLGKEGGVLEQWYGLRDKFQKKVFVEGFGMSESKFENTNIPKLGLLPGIGDPWYAVGSSKDSKFGRSAQKHKELQRTATTTAAEWAMTAVNWIMTEPISFVVDEILVPAIASLFIFIPGINKDLLKTVTRYIALVIVAVVIAAACIATCGAAAGAVLAAGLVLTFVAPEILNQALTDANVPEPEKSYTVMAFSLASAVGSMGYGAYSAMRSAKAAQTLATTTDAAADAATATSQVSSATGGVTAGVSSSATATSSAASRATSYVGQRMQQMQNWVSTQVDDAIAYIDKSMGFKKVDQNQVNGLAKNWQNKQMNLDTANGKVKKAQEALDEAQVALDKATNVRAPDLDDIQTAKDMKLDELNNAKRNADAAKTSLDDAKRAFDNEPFSARFKAAQQNADNCQSEWEKTLDVVKELEKKAKANPVEFNMDLANAKNAAVQAQYRYKVASDQFNSVYKPFTDNFARLHALSLTMTATKDAHMLTLRAERTRILGEMDAFIAELRALIGMMNKVIEALYSRLSAEGGMAEWAGDIQNQLDAFFQGLSQSQTRLHHALA
jgi:hypothetical protein